MSFSRLNYDGCAYKQALKESVRPGDYNINVPFNFQNNNYPYPPTVRLQKNGASMDKKSFLVDIDSDLMGITRKNSKCSEDYYVPCADKLQYGGTCGESLEHGSDTFIPAEDTRTSNPSSNLRGTGFNRWEWLCMNPQDKVMMPFDWNISNRIVSKDNHRPCVPKPLSQTSAWPTPKNLPCDKTNPTCGNFN